MRRMRLRRNEPLPPLGAEGDVAYAAALWTALGGAAPVGEQSIHAPFYEGAGPHGFVLETIFAELTMDVDSGRGSRTTKLLSRG